MNNSVKIINASAGTGKTYRISLEYINLLLKYRDQDVKFEEILTITFTRKAAAEIRERLLKHLSILSSDISTPEKKELLNSLKQINPSLVLHDKEISYLRNIYQKMITNKELINISTIDSFIHRIFNNIVCPYHNITDLELSEDAINEVMPEIYRAIMQTSNLQDYNKIFLTKLGRNLDSYSSLIKDLIQNRWIFALLEHESGIEINSSDATVLLDKYKTSAVSFFEELFGYYAEFQKIKKIKYSTEAYIKIDFCRYLTNLDSEFDKISDLNELKEFLTEVFISEKFYAEEFSLILVKDKNFFLKKNSSYNYANERIDIPEQYSLMVKYLAEYLFITRFAVEQTHLMNLAGVIFTAYDKSTLKRGGKLTYNDVSYHTFRYLYEIDNERILDSGIVNYFYEKLSASFRFVLIDEFQDTGILQLKILLPLLSEIISGEGVKNYGELIVVGDEKQSIYQWRGGKKELLASLPMILNRKVDHDLLNISFRSVSTITKFLNELFTVKPDTNSLFNDILRNNKIEWHHQQIECFKKNEKGYVEINLQVVHNQNKTHVFLVNRISQLILEKRISPARTVILARKNEELENIAALLNEKGINYILDSSSSLFKYRSVKVINYLLYFLAFRDLTYLVRFLRSDLIRMTPEEYSPLIAIMNDETSNLTFEEKITACAELNPVMARMDQLLGADSYQPVSTIIMSIVREFGVVGHDNEQYVYTTETDFRNVQKFIEIAFTFERAEEGYLPTLSDFLKYCRKLEAERTQNQESIAAEDSIKLMTIHKAKGMQFETVFYYAKVSGAGNNIAAGLKYYMGFDESYGSINQLLMTYNYQNILEFCSYKYFIEEKKITEEIEQLNIIYVALTRAVKNLFIYFSTTKIDEDIFKLETKLSEDIGKGFDAERTVFLSLLDLYRKQFKSTGNALLSCSDGELQKSEAQVIKEEKPEETYSFVFRTPDMFKQINYQEMSCSYREMTENFNRKVLGSALHFYLSFIYYNEKWEHEMAESRLFTEFSALLEKNKIIQIIALAQETIKENVCIFTREWDSVYNEFEIFDSSGNEYRIDRMLVNTSEKKILLIDYKSGEYSEEQLENYVSIISNTDFVRKEKYQIESKYILINRDNLSTE